MHETIIGTDDEFRLTMAYGRCVPLFKYREPATLDGWAKMYEILARRPAVCVRDAGNAVSAGVIASQVRAQIDRDKYVVVVAQETQVMVHRRADYEYIQKAERIPWQRDHPPEEWCLLADAAARLGMDTWSARDRLRKENVTREPINNRGALVYRKAEVEAVAIRPWIPGYGRKRPVQRIPWDWYPERAPERRDRRRR